MLLSEAWSPLYTDRVLSPSDVASDSIAGFVGHVMASEQSVA